MEVTGLQMVLMMKLTTFAWDVYDERRMLSFVSPPFFYVKKRGLNCHSRLGQMVGHKNLKDHELHS